MKRHRDRLLRLACRASRRLRGAVLAAALVLASLIPAGAAAFVEGTEDVPLMPGLAMVAGAGTVFDSPEGRIVEAYAQGNAQRAAVLAFYAGTLPQLGWQAIGPGAFRREGETLRLEIYRTKEGREKGALTVRFYLAPG